MRGKGLSNCARQLIKEVSTVRSLDVILTVKEAALEQRELRVRVALGETVRTLNYWPATGGHGGFGFSTEGTYPGLSQLPLDDGHHVIGAAQADEHPQK